MSWIVEMADGSVEQIADAPGTMGNPTGVRSAELPRPIDFATERWDWDAAEIVSRWSPAEARDIVWERAKAYRETRRNAPLSVMLPGGAIVADCDPDSRQTIAGAVQVAMVAQAAGLPHAITFTDAVNQQHTLTGEQIIALGMAVAAHQGACHLASQAIRATLDAAVAAGASADEILGTDITAGYPAQEA